MATTLGQTARALVAAIALRPKAKDTGVIELATFAVALADKVDWLSDAAVTAVGPDWISPEP